MVWNISKIRSNSVYVAQIFLCSGVLGHVKIETKDLVQKIQDMPPSGNQCHDKAGKLLGEIQYPESPPISITCYNGAKIVSDTEIAFSPVAHFEKGLKLTFGCGPQPTLCHCLWFRRRTGNLRSVNVSSQYQYIYLRNITEFPPASPPTRIWDSGNSVKIHVKDLKHKMKAAPKTIRCNNNHLKDLRYDGVTLAVMCSGTRQRYFQAKMALNEYDPMFETTVFLSDGETLFKGVDGSYWSLEPYTFIYTEREKN